MNTWFRGDSRHRRGEEPETARVPVSSGAAAPACDEGAGTAADAGTGPVVRASENGVDKAVGVAAAVDHERALADRQALIQLCLYAMDRARSSGVAERLEHGLASIGVHAVRPDGQRFDPAVHEAGGAVPTEDSALEGTVAETEVVGFVDHDRLLRAPVVTVYTRR
ncbi:nucleotide exchange factor GrpE [Saccharomonospora saliphila]|uniref:nucleotide exchange factor GrpE n=1 Tax=Saccharomonospora saliphila TaxID=369829 RepID=UPI00037473CC|nr:nucleotide exchange factor GrpE [Saccharomonospora saliphila]